MSNPRSGAVRQPANDLAAFDISRQSADDIARLFGRWKEQRKRLKGDEPPPRPRRSTRFMPVVVRSAEPTETAPSPSAAEPAAHADAIQYSSSFANLLATHEKQPVAQQVRAFALKSADRQAPRVAIRRSRLRWVLAGAASFLAVAAASAAVLWQPSAPQQPELAQAQPAPAAHSGATRSHPTAPVEIDAVPMEVQTAARFMPMAVMPPHERAEWELALEIALLQPTPAEAEAAQMRLGPRLKPKPAATQTASTQTSIPAKQSVPAPQAVTWSNVRPSDEEASTAVPPRTAPVASAAPKKQPDSFYQRGNDKAFGGGHAAASAGKSHGDDASGGPSTGGSHSGGATGGDTGDGSGGSGSGAGGASGGTPGGGSGTGGAPGDSPGSGSGSGGAPGSGDASGGDTGNSGSGDTGDSGESGSDGGSSSGNQDGESQGDDGDGSSKPDKPHKGTDVDVHGSIGGGGISVGGHVGGIGGGVGIGH